MPASDLRSPSISSIAVIPELIRSGRALTPGIGIVTANEAVATRLGAEGLIIVRTTQGSPAARAGLRGVDMSIVANSVT